MKNILYSEIFPLMPIKIVEILKKVSMNYLCFLEEIRLRSAKPLMLVIKNKDYMITPDGNFTKEYEKAFVTKRIFLRHSNLLVNVLFILSERNEEWIYNYSWGS